MTNEEFAKQFMECVQKGLINIDLVAGEISSSRMPVRIVIYRKDERGRETRVRSDNKIIISAIPSGGCMPGGTPFHYVNETTDKWCR